MQLCQKHCLFHREPLERALRRFSVRPRVPEIPPEPLMPATFRLEELQV